MGSMSGPDRKRRHLSSLSPTAVTAAAAAKQQPFSPISEDKKLDITVLQFQNQKLLQKLETQNIEYKSLENKLFQLKRKQKPCDSTLAVVKKSWEQLIKELEVCTIRSKKESTTVYAKRMSDKKGHFGEEKSPRRDICMVLEHHSVSKEDTSMGTTSSIDDIFISRLVETGATESSSTFDVDVKKEGARETKYEKTTSILQNIVADMNIIWCLKDGLLAMALKDVSDDGSHLQMIANEVKKLRLALGELHLKHKSLARELQSHRDIDAKNNAELKKLRGDLVSRVAELEENNRKIASLRVLKDAVKGTGFPYLNHGGKDAAGDKVRDKQKDMRDMESSLKELEDQASHQLIEIERLHEERIHIVQELCSLQNKLKDAKFISSAQAFQLLREQLKKSKSDVMEFQALYKKLQFEKDSLIWKEKELNIKTDLVEVVQRSSAVSDSRTADLGVQMQRLIEESKVIENKLEEAIREPGRKQIIAEFKSLVSSFPVQMGSMQSQLRNYKDAASDIHSLRADVQSLSSILDRKAKECCSFSARSGDQLAEIQKLHTQVRHLKESDEELMLILDMYRRESIDSRDVTEARDAEYKAWVQVRSLKFSLDEHNLELRVKTANEVEAATQQRLAAAEAEIADLRQKLEAFKGEMSRLSDILKSKNDAIEAYLSEIETIGQSYDDMQSQNQHLLQQITEREDYNIKLVLEGLRANQKQNILLMEKQAIEQEIQRATATLSLYTMKDARIRDQLKFCSDQIRKLTEERLQRSASLENTQRRLSDVQRSAQLTKDLLEETKSKAANTRIACMELQIKLERERFSLKRIEETLEVARRKATQLVAKIEGSSVVEKLKQELREYKDIVKCSICRDRTKEVVITKCYHLFCNTCVQKSTESRQRKCPICSTSFGANDVKFIYL